MILIENIILATHNPQIYIKVSSLLIECILKLKTYIQTEGVICAVNCSLAQLEVCQMDHLLSGQQI